MTPASEGQLFWEVAESKTKKETKEVPKAVSIDSRLLGKDKK